MQSKGISDKACKRLERALEEPYRGVWRIMYEYGLRISDVIKIKCSDVDEKGFLHYMAQKTGKRARVKLSDEVRRLYFSDVGDFYAFASPRVFGQPVTRQAVWKHIKEACRLLNIDPEGVSPHSGRKHFAKKLFDQKGLGATMAALQHSSPEVTYLYVFDENPFKTYEKQVKALQKKVKTLEKAVEMLSDRVFGDDRYSVV